MPIEPSHPYTVLDVFTDTPLQGNALAVFTEGEAVPTRLMLGAARELHLSETVFLLPGDGDADATVRIFTPNAELPFAGHPVLGAAFVVAERENLATVRLRTGAGVVPVTLRREHGELVYGEMEQPLPSVKPFARARELLEALGISDTVLPVEIYTNGPSHVMVGLDDPDRVAALAPDLGLLAQFGALGIDCFAGLDATAPGSHMRVKCRVFCPGMGMPEDPATGSAAGPLALHLVRHGWAAPGHALTIIQGVELQRTSQLTAQVDGSAENPSRIAVGGGAVMVAHGHFRLQ